MAIKKIDLGEEFVFNGNVWCFEKKDGTIKLIKQRAFGAKSKPKSINPSEEEVVTFFKMKGYNEDAARKFYDFYGKDIEEGQPWKDSKGQVVKNWKMKAKSVWFRDEYKIKEEPKLSPKKEGFLF